MTGSAPASRRGTGVITEGPRQPAGSVSAPSPGDGRRDRPASGGPDAGVKAKRFHQSVDGDNR